MKNLDQFYTVESIAEEYATRMSARHRHAETLFVEPSAGSGAFVKPLIRAERKVRAMDIAPQRDWIDQGDFLSSNNLYHGEHREIVTIGNPPFGKNASLAVKFFNKAATQSNVIAFIVPRTFRKASLQDKLNPMFHLVEDEDVRENAFVHENEPKDVPCAWQIWEKRTRPRAKQHAPNVEHLIEYTDRDHGEFAMRRVGYYAGRVIRRGIKGLSPASHYFMREKTPGIKKTLEAIEWTEIASQTAGVRSVSKKEIARELHRRTK